jgi:uncharacterized membrane protein YwaF
MLFAYPGKYEPCGLFTIDHFKLIIITIIGIIIALKKTIKKSKEEVKQIIKRCTVLVWFLEIIVIGFKLKTGSIRHVNNYVPLYYCSLLLYAGGLASFAKGTLKRVGEVFLATGGIIGGIVFIVMPTTSLPTYPMMHFVSLHSFLFHGIMVYLGLLINITHYIELELKDIKYYAGLVGIVCILAYIINNIFDSNLMFISKNFPGTPIEYIYNFTGPAFTFVMCIVQMTLPFYTIYGIKKLAGGKNG